MPVTLAEAALNTQDDVDRLVIDEFRKQSALLDTLLFHDTVNPMGGGSTLTYGYHRVITERAAYGDSAAVYAVLIVLAVAGAILHLTVSILHRVMPRSIVPK